MEYATSCMKMPPPWDCAISVLKHLTEQVEYQQMYQNSIKDLHNIKASSSKMFYKRY